jgi:hypothetical protein
VEADLALLSSASRRGLGDAAAGEEGGGGDGEGGAGGPTAWVRPQGQTGDGRTSLNDKFGY